MVEDAPVVLIVSQDTKALAEKVTEEIGRFKASGLTVTVLTCKTVENSMFAQMFVDKKRRGVFWGETNVPVYSCRRFKGLEADAVILVDVDRDTWAEAASPYDAFPGLIFYTGASRAKHELRVICCMSDEDAQMALAALGVEGRRKPFSKLAKRLNTMLVEV